MDKLSQAFKAGFNKEAKREPAPLWWQEQETKIKNKKDSNKLSKIESKREFAPSWLEGQKAMQKALRGDGTVTQFFKSKDYLTDKLKTMLGFGAGGAAAGAGLGGLVGATAGGKLGKGLALGSGLGGLAGILSGEYAARSDYLDDKGITTRKAGWGTPKLSREAQKRYL